MCVRAASSCSSYKHDANEAFGIDGTRRRTRSVIGLTPLAVSPGNRSPSCSKMLMSRVVRYLQSVAWNVGGGIKVQPYYLFNHVYHRKIFPSVLSVMPTPYHGKPMCAEGDAWIVCFCLGACGDGRALLHAQTNATPTCLVISLPGCEPRHQIVSNHKSI